MFELLVQLALKVVDTVVGKALSRTLYWQRIIKRSLFVRGYESAEYRNVCCLPGVAFVQPPQRVYFLVENEHPLEEKLLVRVQEVQPQFSVRRRAKDFRGQLSSFFFQKAGSRSKFCSPVTLLFLPSPSPTGHYANASSHCRSN